MLNFQVKGYEDMELSTQVLIAAALERGLMVEILDREANFFALKSGAKIEYIKEATKTSLDDYVTVEIMGNKLVTKNILAKNGIRVPLGMSFNNFNLALAEIKKRLKSPLVIKPKTTNYGEGVGIFPDGADEKQLEKALRAAFSYDDSVLVEEYISGIECRFLVIGEQCAAVLHRMPANVSGDGISTISALVEAKNRDPRRGFGHKTPLEKIRLGEDEETYLSSQGLKFSSVPDIGRRVFLRANSNISTGGDSFDYTDLVHESYKMLAVRAAKAVGARICGVDMLLSAHEHEATDNNYAIIELNYNPVLYFHNFPYEGENRRVAEPILDLLGF